MTTNDAKLTHPFATYNFSGLQGGEAGRAERGPRSGGIDHHDEGPTVSEVVRGPEHVLGGRQDLQRLDLAVLPGQDLVGFSRSWNQPDLDPLRVAENQEERWIIA